MKHKWLGIEAMPLKNLNSGKDLVGKVSQVQENEKWARDEAQCLLRMYKALVWWGAGAGEGGKERGT
jgi:hypothetical protein